MFKVDKNVLGSNFAKNVPLDRINKRLFRNRNDDIHEEIEIETKELPFVWEFELGGFWIVLFLSTMISLIDPTITCELLFSFSYKSPKPEIKDIFSKINQFFPR